MLRGKTGRLLWRFRVAPAERRIPVYQSIQSTWPAAAGVLVKDGTAYVAAGISNYDGTYIFALDASTSCVGWCWGDNDRYVKSGIYQPKGFDAWNKIEQIQIWLSDFLFARGGLFNCLAYEHPSGNKGNMHANLVLGGLMYGCIATFRHYHETVFNTTKKNVPIIFVRPSSVKATGIYKDQLDAARKYKDFQPVYKPSGTINRAAMLRIGNELDAIGVWLAGLKILKEQGKC